MVASFCACAKVLGGRYRTATLVPERDAFKNSARRAENFLPPQDRKKTPESFVKNTLNQREKIVDNIRRFSKSSTNKFGIFFRQDKQD
jgi:hypothetical protein